ncbi:MAG: phosphoribosyl-ATP pyrophosphohydrolase [Firmicutes bacterium]|nr:phosphoribosyl-ATP pyrophosphohydrolase [Bacillota bacterium]
MTYKKLVRDNIPDIIAKNGEKPIFRILSDEEYKKELEKKLLEECNEVINADGNDRVEELADLLEVVMCLAKLQNKKINDILKVSEIKRDKRGTFAKKIYLENVEK